MVKKFSGKYHAGCYCEHDCGHMFTTNMDIFLKSKQCGGIRTTRKVNHRWTEIINSRWHLMAKWKINVDLPCLRNGSKHVRCSDRRNSNGWWRRLVTCIKSTISTCSKGDWPMTNINIMMDGEFLWQDSPLCILTSIVATKTRSYHQHNNRRRTMWWLSYWLRRQRNGCNRDLCIDPSAPMVVGRMYQGWDGWVQPTSPAFFLWEGRGGTATTFNNQHEFKSCGSRDSTMRTWRW